MAVSNYDRVGKALDVLKNALKPFVLREIKSAFGSKWLQQVHSNFPESSFGATLSEDISLWDVQVLLSIMWNSWHDAFKKVLGYSERNLIAELRNIRNDWAHQKAFSTDDTYRAFDTIERLLTAVSVPESAVIAEEKQELLRVRYSEQARKKAKKFTVKIKTEAKSGLKPWREIITPHPDVASGRFQQAEFAADLWQVYLEEGSSEYRDPKEFYRRTFITDGIRQLLISALRRLSGKGGDPVIELQTNFGGGKTHSLIALYHLFSGIKTNELPGVEELLSTEKLHVPQKVNRAIIVGNKIPPGDLDIKKDGTKVRTLWGEIAWQLGGSDGYAMVAEADRTSTNPGDQLKDLFNKYSPCLILFDEWIAHARQLYTNNTLPAGTFDTQFTFAQTLSESAKNAEQTFLVVSIPASDNEIGGEGGREALVRLRNAIGRVQSPWRPASAEEGFEIVRRRLFQEKIDYKAKGAVVRAFADLYREQSQEFPPECKEAEYERRLERAYPIHPELFDRLYNTWSTLDRFQRTRGVLRLMATVIFSLWDKGDQSLMILPSSVPIDDPNVQSELTKFLEEHWIPVIEQDVDGEASIPRKLDKENANLGRYSATRRVSRTIYMGSAPVQALAHKGIEEKSIKLGSVQPGEHVAIFGDALRRLTDRTTYLYVDSGRYWYSTQPTVRKLAEDRAGQYNHEVADEINHRLSEQAQSRGDFERVHVTPKTGADVVDEPCARLVILQPQDKHTAKLTDSAAIKTAKEILESRGTGPRIFKNALVFLAPDTSRMGDLEQAVRYYLAWTSILIEKDQLNLDVIQTQQAETQKKSAEGTVRVRITETYCWLLVPEQANPTGEIGWVESRLQGQSGLAPRASQRMTNDETLMTNLGGSRLRIDLDRIPLWRGNHILVSQLADDFFKYIYLSRLKNISVLIQAIEDGVSLLSWEQDSFAYADAWNEEKQRYRGLKAHQLITAVVDSNAVIVKPSVAIKQMDEENPPKPPQPPEGEDEGGESEARGHDGEHPELKVVKKVKRFYGHVTLDPMRAGRDAGKISEEVVQHMLGLVGSEVKLTLDIQVEAPNGIPEEKQRIVNENCTTLKFETFEFEEE